MSVSTPSRDDFAALLDESLHGREMLEGQVVHGLVVGVEKGVLGLGGLDRGPFGPLGLGYGPAADPGRA